MVDKEGFEMVVFLAVLGVVFGGMWGSFLHVVYWRLPRMLENLKRVDRARPGYSLSVPDSHCPVCSHKLSAMDNIPVVGWLGRGGKCRYCGAKIAVRYLLWEIFFCVLGGAAAVGVGDVYTVVCASLVGLVFFVVAEGVYVAVWYGRYRRSVE